MSGQYYYKYFSNQYGGGEVKKVKKTSSSKTNNSNKSKKTVGPGGITFKDKIHKIPKSVYIPAGFKLDNSTIKGAGLGIFAERDLPSGYDMGAYKGEWITPEEYAKTNRDMLYVWEVNDYRGNKDRPRGQKLDVTKAIGYVDAEKKKHGNYLRYLNHPTNKSQENVKAKQIGKDIHYVTIRPVKKGEELMVNYGPSYSQMLLGKVI